MPFDPTRLLAAAETTRLASHFFLLDWVVLIGYMALVSVLGVMLAGKQKDMKDFFRGGDKLPWYAVSGSMIATIISAVTFVGVPAIVYRDGGNFTYLQFGLIAGLLSRLFVTLFIVPAYYRERIYSPYDYIGKRLGSSAKLVTTAMFTVLGVLGQSARVYLTASILALILDEPLHQLQQLTGVPILVLAITLVGIVSILWTMLGGIATVIWTDAMLFLVFVAGGLITLGCVIMQLPGGAGQLFADAAAADKFSLWSVSLAFDATQPYTLWAAIFAVTFGNIGAYGTDQLLAQRILCCKNANHARAAVMGSWLGEAVVALMLLVGAGLWVFYEAFPERLSGAAGQAVADNPDMIFPVFMLTQVPAGLTGLIVAGIFAAAISSLTSILAALAQTSLSAVILPWRGIDLDNELSDSANRFLLRWSRGLIVGWGVVLCVFAWGIAQYVDAMAARGRDVPFLDLALGLASYVIGTLFAAFLLAWVPLRINGYGLLWSAPLSILAVVAVRFHDPVAQAVCAAVGGLLLVGWGIATLRGDPALRGERMRRTVPLAVGVAGVWLLSRYFYFVGDAGEVQSIAWPWYAPIGGAYALALGYLLADRRDETPPPA